MRRRRSTGPKLCLAAGVLGCAAAAHGACTGPQALVAQMRAQPTGDNAGVLGSWYASHQQFDCALDVFRAGLKADPQSAQLHYVTGLTLAALKRPDDAITELKTSTELDGSALKPHIILASLYDESNKPEDAEREWRKAFSIDPNAGPVLEGLSAEFMKRQDYPSVIQLLMDAPKNEKLTIELSRALGLLNDYAAAGEVLQEALKAHPDSEPIMQAMIVVLVNQRKHEEAIKMARAILEKRPNDEEIRIELLRLLVLTDHLDDAKVLGPEVLATSPHDPEVVFLNGLIRHSLGDNEGARKLLEEAISLQPDFGNSRYELGNVLVVLKQWKEAKEQLEKAISLGVNAPEAHFALGRALHALGENERADQEIKKYGEIKQEGEARLEAVEAIAQGDQELEAGKFAEAETHYREAITSQPRNANYRFKLSVVFQRAGDTAKEKQSLMEAIQIDPKLPGAQNALGYLLSRNGDAPGSVEHFKAAVDAAPGWTEAWINLAAELAVTSRFAEARKAVARALELDPANAQAKELSDQLTRDPAAQPNHN
ncbi:MAG TPA: tetratricopeptide repeat protein [Terracidiphilus sp.]